MTLGITFDTGALIALERRRQRISRVYTTALLDGLIVTVPIVVLAEWWRGASAVRDIIFRGVRIEPADATLAKATGETLAAIRGATLTDAWVMVSAARRGDVVYTSDHDDLARIGRRFPGVRVLSV